MGDRDVAEAKRMANVWRDAHQESKTQGSESAEKEMQEVAAILECTDRQFLPPAILQKTDVAGGRASLQERLTALKQLVREL